MKTGKWEMRQPDRVRSRVGGSHTCSYAASQSDWLAESLPTPHTTRDHRNLLRGGSRVAAMGFVGHHGMWLCLRRNHRTREFGGPDSTFVLGTRIPQSHPETILIDEVD